MIYVIESETIQRYLNVTDGKLSTSHFRGLQSGEDLFPGKDSREFIFLFTDGSRISSDELTVSEVKRTDSELTVKFEPYDGLEVSVCYRASSDDLAVKKQVFFSDGKKRRIDCIIPEYLDLSNAVSCDFSSQDIDGNELSGYHFSLGQPFYADSFFFGSEFPATENSISDGIGAVKYFSGKAFPEVSESPVSVAGGARSKKAYDLRTAFFEYIDSISLPCSYRLQYNSWYDGMLDITEGTIQKAFCEVAEAFEKNGIPKPNAYTVDDGWNDYKAPFWSFNAKFPSELAEVSELTKKLGSSLGLWFGPRGGYNYQKTFAKRMQRKKLGAYNSLSHDICIADRTYRQNAKKFLLETVSRLDLSYLKLDGFCLKPCSKKRHSHIVGGHNGMYAVTEMWEGWTEIFKSLRALRASQGKDIWLNMTCYVNPSPWWFQYVNSVWLQNSSDIGFSDAYKGQSQADAEISYRDSRYFELLTRRKCRVPLCRIYNHEPIYGKSAKIQYSDADFEKYLMFCACRGQSLNELHLSCSIMNDEKWKILSRAIKWQKENYRILKNAVFTGQNPDAGKPYAFCSFTDDGRGIAAIRNPSDSKAEFDLILNGKIGFLSTDGEFKAERVFGDEHDLCESYSCGDTVELELKPFEILILSFNKQN